MSLATISRIGACILFASALTHAYAKSSTLEYIYPSETDPNIKQHNDANVVLRPKNMDGAPLMVFLPGTDGKPENAKLLLSVAAEQGYRAIGLEYNDTPAVIQICPKNPDPDCSANFREMRTWGTGPGAPRVSNPANESIEGRLVSLLKLLAKKYPNEKWDAYLTPDNKPVWSKIAVTGLSQGAGMAALIAKKYLVYRVILFSCPIDYIGAPETILNSNTIQLAPWINNSSVTPPDQWYAERNSREPFNPGLSKAYPLLGIPADHIRVNDLGLPPGVVSISSPMFFHTANIMDERYSSEWRFFFGKVPTN
jgi:hypothetical protein